MMKGVTRSMRYHEILIIFTRATRVPPSGVDFFNTLKDVSLLEETGKPQMLFFGKRKMHPDVRQKFARYRTLFSQKSKCTEV